MKLKSGFVLEEVGGSYLAVAVGERAEEFKVLIRMNATGAFLWSIISESDVTESELAARLVERYGIDTSLAERDVASFVKMLRNGGLLDD